MKKIDFNNKDNKDNKILNSVNDFLDEQTKEELIQEFEEGKGFDIVKKITNEVLTEFNNLNDEGDEKEKSEILFAKNYFNNSLKFFDLYSKIMNDEEIDPENLTKLTEKFEQDQEIVGNYLLGDEQIKKLLSKKK